MAIFRLIQSSHTQNPTTIFFSFLFFLKMVSFGFFYKNKIGRLGLNWVILLDPLPNNYVQIDSWVGPRNNKKTYVDQISINKISNEG